MKRQFYEEEVQGTFMAQICNRCEFLLSHFYLATHQHLRTAIMEHAKGYIGISVFAQDSIIANIFRQLNIFNKQRQCAIIRKAIEDNSTKLRVNMKSVRLINSYEAKHLSVLPLYTDSLPENTTQEQLYKILSHYVGIYAITISEELGCKYGLIYCEDNQKILTHNQYLQNQFCLTFYPYQDYVETKQALHSLDKIQLQPLLLHQNIFQHIRQNRNHFFCQHKQLNAEEIRNIESVRHENRRQNFKKKQGVEQEQIFNFNNNALR